MFIVVKERLSGRAEVIGPFPHEEDARAYAEENCRMFIWRVTTLTPPPAVPVKGNL